MVIFKPLLHDIKIKCHVSFPKVICIFFLVSFLEKRPSLGSSFSSFQIPSQRDPGLRLRRRSGSEDQDEESKENVEERAGNDLEKRHSHASNGDMNIPWKDESERLLALPRMRFFSTGRPRDSSLNTWLFWKQWDVYLKLNLQLHLFLLNLLTASH